LGTKGKKKTRLATAFEDWGRGRGGDPTFLWTKIEKIGKKKKRSPDSNTGEGGGNFGGRVSLGRLLGGPIVWSGRKRYL